MIFSALCCTKITPCNLRVITVDLLPTIQFTATLVLFPCLSFLNFCINPNKLFLCHPLHTFTTSTSFKAPLKYYILQINISKFQISGMSGSVAAISTVATEKLFKAVYLVAECLQPNHTTQIVVHRQTNPSNATGAL